MCSALVLEHAEGEITNLRDDVRQLEIPTLPSEIFSRIREDIPFFDEVAAESVSELMSWYQVQNSRLDSIKGRDSVRLVQEFLFDIVKLKVMVNALFAYARSRGNDAIEIEYTLERVRRGVLTLIPLRYPDRDALEASVVKRFESRLGKLIFEPEFRDPSQMPKPKTPTI